MANASRLSLNMFSSYQQAQPRELPQEVSDSKGICRLLVLAPRKGDDIPIRGNRHIKYDRAAANLAVLDILLLWQGVVDQDGDGLTTVRASDCLFVEFRHV